jgi:hypothetical protein
VHFFSSQEKKCPKVGGLRAAAAKVTAGAGPGDRADAHDDLTVHNDMRDPYLVLVRFGLC